MKAAEIFGIWMKEQGQRVFHTESSFWHEQGPRVFQAFPYHWLITPSENELSQFLRETNALGLRYSSPIEAQEGYLSYHAVYDDSHYDIEQLSKWSRKNTKRGLANCVVEPISLEYLADMGWQLQLDTLDRQGLAFDVDTVQKAWKLRCMSAAKLEGFEAWGAFVERKLAASVITFLMDDCVYMLFQQCHRDFLPQHVNNALSYTVTKTMIVRPNVKSILYGLHSLDAPSSVDEFKFRMGYKAKRVRQRVVFHPFVSFMFNPLSYSAVKKLAAVKPDNRNLAKVEGMMRFYLDGKRPLSEQSQLDEIDAAQDL